MITPGETIITCYQPTELILGFFVSFIFQFYARACFCFVFLSPGFCLVLALVARVCYCLFFVFVCLEFQIIRLVISPFTPIFFIEISFVLLPPPPQLEQSAANRLCRSCQLRNDVLPQLPDTNAL